MHRRHLLIALLLALPVPLHAHDQPPAPRRLRVLSYNIHHGEGTDKKFDLPRLAKLIVATEADLVALNEVDKKTRRASGVDQPAELAKLTGMTAVFERNIVYQGGDYGNAILSRLPVKRHQNHKLPSMYEGEQRGILEVEVDLGGAGPLLFFATHLDYRADDKERRASYQTIEELTAKRGDQAAVLAGDLNAEPASEVMKSFASTWHIAKSLDQHLTYPSHKPVKQIDYVLCRPAKRWKVIEVRVIDEPVASDHRPILAVLELQKPQEPRPK
jgi:endonuclease/exonuclease/phosphatase family metal-dependent hydrolase